jgi:hypothetical protein
MSWTGRVAHQEYPGLTRGFALGAELDDCAGDSLCAEKMRLISVWPQSRATSCAVLRTLQVASASTRQAMNVCVRCGERCWKRCTTHQS